MRVTAPAILALSAACAAAPSLSAQTRAPSDSLATVALSTATLERYIAVKAALGPYWQSHRMLLATARSTGSNVAVPGPGAPQQVGVFDYPALATQSTTLAALFTANHFMPAQFEPVQVAVYRALGQLSAHAVTGAALPDPSTAAGKNVNLVYSHLYQLAGVGVVAPSAPAPACDEATATSAAAAGAGVESSARSPSAAPTPGGIPTAADDVTVVPFFTKPNETPLEKTKVVIEAEIDGHRGVFIFDLGDTPTSLNRTFLQPNARGGVDTVTQADAIPDHTPWTNYESSGIFPWFDRAHVTVRVGSLVSHFEDPEFMKTLGLTGPQKYNVELGHLWGNFGWVFAPRLGNLGPAVFQPFETIVDYTHRRVVLIRLDSAGHRVINVPAYTPKAEVPLLNIPTGLGAMTGLGVAVNPCGKLDTTDLRNDLAIMQLDTGSPGAGRGILGYSFLSSFGAFGINQKTHRFILYR